MDYPQALLTRPSSDSSRDADSEADDFGWERAVHERVRKRIDGR